MDIRQAYNVWAEQYDTTENKTRDLEAKSLIETLSHIPCNRCLEIGCGTGKNTIWLLTKANRVTAIDFAEEMLNKAKEKINSDRVQFIKADITKEWTFANESYDLIVCSLVLEHLENLNDIFTKISEATTPGGYVYVGELHPFKQYMGTKARYETPNGPQILKCFTHHLSDFTQAAKQNGFTIVHLNEYFDDEDKTQNPRILSLLFQKQLPL